MVQVELVAETWSKHADVDSADEVIEAEGMSWQRDDGAGDVPRYVPAVAG